uniref:Bestrophin homolog n=1 Tax=Loa loa TaxID=7209 RepID=A0A1I7VFS9_LOALO
MLGGIEVLDPSCFYGSSLGFQFPPSVGRIFRLICVILAIYSLSWKKGRNTLGSLLNSPWFIRSPEQRTRLIVKQVPLIFCLNMTINELREIRWVGSVTVGTTNGGTVKIPESSYIEPRPAKSHILSGIEFFFKEVEENQTMALNLYSFIFRALLDSRVNFHHRRIYYFIVMVTYLRAWAKLLNCSVVSVEYSLAPGNPFPRPTEDVLYAYAYIINNATRLGLYLVLADFRS